MLSTIVRSLVCAVTLLALAMVPAVAQTPLDKRVIFSFSGPVTLPGVTLPAGTDLFRVPNATSSRNLVQVLNADGTKIYGTFFAIPAHRPVAPEKPEVRFMETPSSMVHAIRTWWYPADSAGFEFIYPKEQARLLAKGAGQSVLTTQAQTKTTVETSTDRLTRISSTGQETNIDVKAAPVSATPTGEISGGELASPALVIPSNPTPVKIDD
jgi:hypothetical protein